MNKDAFIIIMLFLAPFTIGIFLIWGLMFFGAWKYVDYIFDYIKIAGYSYVGIGGLFVLIAIIGIIKDSRRISTHTRSDER